VLLFRCTKLRFYLSTVAVLSVANMAPSNRHRVSPFACGFVQTPSGPWSVQMAWAKRQRASSSCRGSINLARAKRERESSSCRGSDDMAPTKRQRLSASPPASPPAPLRVQPVKAPGVRKRVQFGAPIRKKYVLWVDGERAKLIPRFTPEERREVYTELDAYMADMDTHPESRDSTNRSSRAEINEYRRQQIRAWEAQNPFAAPLHGQQEEEEIGVKEEWEELPSWACEDEEEEVSDESSEEEASSEEEEEEEAEEEDLFADLGPSPDLDFLEDL
jgi:hypothetical protein